MKPGGRKAVLAAAALLLALGVVLALRDDGTSSDGRSTAATTTAPPEPYSLGRTRACARAEGFTVAPVRSTDPRLRALGDLAQQTSFQAERGGMTLGVAFGDARLLESLLRVPDDPYRLEVRRNALLMYRPAARGQAAVLRGCLRP